MDSATRAKLREEIVKQGRITAGEYDASARQSKTPVVRTKYTGPDPDRINRGNFVSREELADFQRQNPGGTLRDLLNADQGLKRRGAQPANLAGPRRQSSGRGPSVGRTADDDDTYFERLPYNPRIFPDTKTPEPKEDALTRIARLPPARSPEEEIDEAKNRTLTALSLMGGLGATQAAKMIAGRMGAKSAAGQSGPNVRADLRSEYEAYRRGGVDAMRAEQARKAAAKRVDSRKTQGEELDRPDPPFKRGGAVKTYSKGGSVKGAGCEQRGLRKCKVC